MTTLVVARAANGVIGRDGALPWRLPADLKRFRALTLGRAVVMGRRTFESIGRPLPGRRNIVLTGSGWTHPGAQTAATLAAALALGGPEAMVIGGARVYLAALPVADRIELTEVHAEPEGDTALPPFGPQWRETWREDHAAEGDAPAFSFVTLARA